MSVSYQKCTHEKSRHSPDGFNIIEECEICFKAWQIQGITGAITLLPDSWMIRVTRKQATRDG